MFVQLNPDTASYTESLSTLKFAERASGVELGAAKSSKEGRDVRELMEQVASAFHGRRVKNVVMTYLTSWSSVMEVVSLRDTITKREEEIERLQLLKDLKNVNLDKRGLDTSRLGSPSRNQKPLDGAGSGQSEKASHEHGNSPEITYNDESKLIGDSEEDCEERTSNASDSMEAETEGVEEDPVDQSEGSEQPDNLREVNV